MASFRQQIRFTWHASDKLQQLNMTEKEAIDLLLSSTQFDENAEQQSRKLTRYRKTYAQQQYVFHFFNGRIQFIVEQHPNKDYDLVITVTDTVQYIQSKKRKYATYADSLKGFKRQRRQMLEQHHLDDLDLD